ncbi:MAG: hypothetical protein HY364_04260 [Candidatus Aenigmarchaeota archaeon]|nr:hypothetical protein [Candidatus Aenigmarchaeota archaeon]
MSGQCETAFDKTTTPIVVRTILDTSEWLKLSNRRYVSFWSDSTGNHIGITSEGLSFDIINKQFGVSLDKTEDFLKEGVDYTVKIGDEIAGVSVKRIISNSPTTKKFFDVISEANSEIVQKNNGRWSYNIIHILVKNDDEVKLAEEGVESLLDTPHAIEDITNFKVIITKVPDYLMKVE